MWNVVTDPKTVSSQNEIRRSERKKRRFSGWGRVFSGVLSRPPDKLLTSEANQRRKGMIWKCMGCQRIGQEVFERGRELLIRNENGFDPREASIPSLIWRTSLIIAISHDDNDGWPVCHWLWSCLRGEGNGLDPSVGEDHLRFPEDGSSHANFYHGHGGVSFIILMFIIFIAAFMMLITIQTSPGSGSTFPRPVTARRPIGGEWGSDWRVVTVITIILLLWWW